MKSHKPLKRKTPLRAKSGFKKRGKLKKVSKQKISVLQRKIWEHCKRITRARYGNSCYTCPAKNLQGSDQQTGHMWAKASLGAFLKYDLRILRIQCAKCNRWNDGMGADFYARMLSEIGEEKMKQLQKDRKKEVRAYEHYEKLLQEYQQIEK